MDFHPPVESIVREPWKILVIDDDEDDFLIVKEMLKEAQGNSFEVHWASSYRTGCDAIHADQYNAVLVDYDLGAETGIRLIRDAVEKGYSTPLILFTGRGTYAVDLEAMEAGATLYLAKGDANPLLLERIIRYAIELKQREQALRVSEERFEKAFNASPDAQVISHMEDGRIETINDSFEKLFGYLREEVVGKSSLELNLFSNPADRDEAIRLLRTNQRVRDFVLDIRTRTGEIRTASLSVEIISISDQRLMLTVIEDITERRRAEEALRESESRYRSLYEAMDEGFMLSEVIFDEHDRPVDILYHQANPAAVRILGMDYTGKRLTEIDPNFEPYWFETWARVARSGVGERLEAYAEPLKTWYNFYIFRSGGPGSRIVANVFEDITARKQAEASLKTTAARDAYLVKLADSLRPRSDPVDIQSEAERLLGEYLGASRVMYGEVGEGGEDLIVERNYVDKDTPLLIGRFQMADFGPALVQALNAGHTVVMPDIAAATAISEAEREAFLTLGIAAAISVPLTKAGKFVANLNVQHAAPRAWTQNEITLVEETAERTWAAVERARAEIALRERESRLREFLENTHDAYFALDREWRFTYANHRLGSLMGIDPLHVIGKNFWELYPQYLGTDIEQCYRKVMAERIPIHLRRQGEITNGYFDLSLYPTQEGLASFASDRTEEMRQQQQVEDERARLEAVLRALPVGVWITDIHGQIIGKNQHSDQIWAGNAPMSENWEMYAEYEMRYPDSGKPRPLDEYPLVRVLSTGQPVEPQENLIRRFDGSYSFALVSASPIKDREGRLTGAAAIMLDISERKRAEMELRKSEASLRESERSLAEAQRVAHIGSWRWNVQTGELHWSDEMYAIYGLEPNSFVPTMQSFAEFIHPVDRGLINQQIHSILKGSAANFQFRILRADGTERILKVTGEVTEFDENGKPRVMVGVNQDITEQVRLEAEKKQAIYEREIHHQLAEQREMERQSIARDIHDGPIQTLSGLLFNLQSLREIYTDPALQLEVDRVKLSIKSSVQELRQVMYELRPPSVIKFGISKAIRSHNENLLEVYPQITWNLDLDDDGLLLPQQTSLMLFRVYQEAVNNIIRHSEAGQAWVKVKVLNDQILLEVRDNGKGFVMSQDLAHLTDKRHFGLAGIAERVEAINGILNITSTPGEGTIIAVKVPIATSNAL